MPMVDQQLLEEDPSLCHDCASQRAWCKGRSDRTPLEGVSYYSIGGHNVTDAVGMGRLCEFIEGSVCAVGE